MAPPSLWSTPSLAAQALSDLGKSPPFSGKESGSGRLGARAVLPDCLALHLQAPECSLCLLTGA